MDNLKYFLRLFIFWLIYFFVNRLLFIANYFQEFYLVSIEEVLRIFPMSFRLDVSFIGYLFAIITIVLFLNSFFPSKRVNIFITGIIFWVNTILIIVSSVIIGGEIGIYSEWGAKLNFTALSHFVNPKEVFLTARLFNYLIMLQ